MSRRLLLLAIALMVATAPIAHEICHLSCATPSPLSSTRMAQSSGHDHCAQAQKAQDAATSMSAAGVSDCRSQDNAAAVTSSLIKVATKAPMIASERAGDALVATIHVLPRASATRASVRPPTRTELRV